MLEKGQAVVVTKGRKVAKGTRGVIGWIGSNHFGWSVGLVIDGVQGLTFTALSNVERDEAPDALAREIDAAHESALWFESKRIEREAGLIVAKQVLGSVTLQKGDIVTPKSGAYAGRACRVIWVGAKAEGVRVGVVPKPGRPSVRGGRPVWPSYNAEWLPLAEVAVASEADTFQGLRGRAL